MSNNQKGRGNNRSRRESGQNNQKKTNVLATRIVGIGHKRVFMDVLAIKDKTGRPVVKLAEVTQGYRSNLYFSMQSAKLLEEVLVDINEFHDERLRALGPNTDVGSIRLAEYPEELRSFSMVRKTKKYYVDVNENTRGVYLKISESSRWGTRSTLLIPVVAVDKFTAGLSDLLDMHYDAELDEHADGVTEESKGGKETIPESKAIKAPGKTIYLDISRNWYGCNLLVSEVTKTFRERIAIPESHWVQVRDGINDMIRQRGLEK